MRAAIYARVSSRNRLESEASHVQNVENQLAMLRGFAGQMEWELAGEYVDRGVTGTKGTNGRDQFAAMFTAASRREFDILLFWSLDRLSREGVLDTLLHLQRLTSYGVNWRSYTEQYLDSTGIFREAVIGILAAIAKQESVRMSERTKAGLERARAQGKTLGRRTMADEQPKKALDAQQMRAEGMSLRLIAKTLEISVGTVRKLIVAGGESDYGQVSE
jgi:DNA invertase Pin-like site-specific DNA recombinase